MKSKLLSLAISLAILVGLIFSLASCDPREFEGVTFKDARYMYDGFEHTIAVEGAPEEANITYSSPNTQTEEGIYVITATISAEGYITKTLTATLTIKGASNSSSNGDADAMENLLDFYPLPDGTYGVKMGKTQYLDKVEIPSTYNGKPVTMILKDGFSKSQATEIIIPNTINKIDDNAFSNCINLTSITIPDSVTSIGSYAFSNCTSLASVTIPDGVTSIGNSAFNDCDSLTSVTIPDSITSIGYEAFAYCDSLTSVTIGNGVESIGDNAFYGCYKLVEVINKSSLNIVAGSEEYGYVAYYAKEVHTEESKIVNKDGYLFYTYVGVNYLIGYTGDDTELTLPESYNGEKYEIYNYAFYNCDSLTSVTIGNGVTSIGNCAFQNCNSLTSIKYRGTETQWNAISKGSYWDSNTGSYTITYNYTGE